MRKIIALATMLAVVLAATAPALAQSQSNSATLGDQYAQQDQLASQFNAVQSDSGESTTPENGASGGEQSNAVEFGDQIVNQFQNVFQSNFFSQTPVEEEPEDDEPEDDEPEDDDPEDDEPEDDEPEDDEPEDE